MLRILVVDDEPIARDIMVRYLNNSENGIEIIGTASDGYEAVEMITANHPDIVFIDIEMPGMSGLDVIKKTRDLNLPISFIIISSYSVFRYAQTAIKLDVVEYILKPFLPLDIYSAVYRAANKLILEKQLNIDEEMLASISGFLQPLISSLAIVSPISYPFEQEEAILLSLSRGTSFDSVAHSLLEFYNFAMANNAEEAATIICLSILLIEICHFIMKQGLKTAVFNLAPLQVQPLDLSQQYFGIISSLCDNIMKELLPNVLSKSIIAMAIKYINDNFAKHISLSDVSQHVGLSHSYLSSLFTQTTGIHFTDYLNNVRIAKAQAIIADNPPLKNYEVSNMVGYTSEKYFSKIFKRITGKTVSQFRSSL